MKTGAAVAAIAVAATRVWAGGAAQTDERTVRVCVHAANADLLLTALAQGIASRMFAGIGVKMDWHRALRACPPASGSIVVTFDDGEGPGAPPGALAYALPYEGTHIVVALDRVQKLAGPRDAPSLLAHVLAHEITHSLQGVNRHSWSGVMKARWSAQDELDMFKKPLHFTEEDVQLIYMGLHSRESRVAASAGSK